MAPQDLYHVAHPTPAELDGISKIRHRFDESFVETSVQIPDDLNTNFNLNRWWRWYHGDLDKIYARMSQYIVNRRLLKLDRPDLIDVFWSLPSTLKVVQFFSMSLCREPLISVQNAVLFMMQGHFEPKVCDVMMANEYLKAYHGMCEIILQLILRREKLTGEPSFCITLFNFEGMHLANHSTPNSPANKQLELRARVFQDFYPGLVSRVLVVNPPPFIGLVWRMVSFFFEEHARKIISYVSHHDELRQHMDESIIPLEFGGTGVDPEIQSEHSSVCTIPIVVTKEMHYVEGSIWKRFGIDKENVPKNQHGKAHAGGKTYHFTVKAFAGQHIVWHIKCSHDFFFSAYWHENEDVGPQTFVLKYQVHPHLLMTTQRTPEEDSLKAEKTGYYTFLLKNTSHYFSMKVTHAALVIDEREP